MTDIAFEELDAVMAEALEEIEASGLDPSEIERNFAESDKLQAEREKLHEETAVVRLVLEREQIALAKAKQNAKFSGAADIENRTYRFDDSVSRKSCAECGEYLSRWARMDPARPVEIVLTTGGGDVWYGMALVDQMLALRKAHNEAGFRIKVTVRGTAASMGAVILQAADERVMGPSSTLLLHKLSAGFEGTIDAFEDYTVWLKIMQDQADNLIADRSKLSLAQVRAGMKRKDWALGPDEALAKGLIDRIG